METITRTNAWRGGGGGGGGETLSCGLAGAEDVWGHEG